jgi:predicted cupin superfamily sugar epimerase
MPARRYPDAGDLSAERVIDLLNLEPHPEGGHYRETFRDRWVIQGRSAGTAIFFLLKEGEVSAWHRVDAVEIWHWYAGAPLELRIASEGSKAHQILLGSDLENGHCPQAIVPKDYWQTARSLGSWTLAGCTVAPGFEFSGFELAPREWEPETAKS